MLVAVTIHFFLHCLHTCLFLALFSIALDRKANIAIDCLLCHFSKINNSVLDTKSLEYQIRNNSRKRTSTTENRDRNNINRRFLVPYEKPRHQKQSHKKQHKMDNWNDDIFKNSLIGSEITATPTNNNNWRRSYVFITDLYLLLFFAARFFGSLCVYCVWHENMHRTNQIDLFNLGKKNDFLKGSRKY